MEFVLRKATPEDAVTVSRLFRKSFTATFRHLYPPAELEAFLADQPPEHFARCAEAADHLLLLGETAAGDALGYGLLGPYADLSPHLPEELGGRRWWAMRQLYLLEAAKGTGLADALMHGSVEESRRRGFQDLLLTVWIDNRRARRFYERHGFREVGSYPFVVGSTTDDDRILRLVL